MNPNVKTSHQLLFIQNMLFLSILCGLFCASHANIIRLVSRSKCHQESVDEELTRAKLTEREVAQNKKNAENFHRLVNILKSLGQELIQSVENSDSELTESLLREIKEVWQSLVDNQIGLANSNESAASLKTLKTYMAHILFIANDRICESPDETFYQGQCLPISTENWSEYCPENMGLFDGPDNEGICDCVDLSAEKAKSELRQIYSEESGSCHRQNTQGHCDYGQWFVVVKNTTQCVPVPEGCPTDGRHVYWSPEPSIAKKCWEIWTQGPCEEGKLIHLSQETEELKVFCSFRFAGSTGSTSLHSYYCPRGSYRNRRGQCCSYRYNKCMFIG